VDENVKKKIIHMPDLSYYEGEWIAAWWSHLQQAR
jgi:hypothetical protein